MAMPDITAFFRNQCAQYLTGKGAPQAILGCYVDLYSGDPQGAGVSVLAALSGSGNRTNIASALGSGVNGVVTNAAEYLLIASVAAAASVSHIALFDAVTGGNLIASDSLPTGTKSYDIGDPVRIPAGGINITIS